MKNSKSEHHWCRRVVWVYLPTLLLVVLSSISFAASSVKDGEKLLVTNKALEPIEMEGVIDRVSIEDIVIDDSLYTYSSSIKYLTRYGVKSSRSSFSKGQKVTYAVDGQEVVLLRKK